MLKRFAVLVALIGLVGGLFLPALASAQSAPPASIIMKLVAGLTDQAQVDVIATNGGILRSSIPALRLYVIGVPAAELADTLARYQADPRVERAEENKVRLSESVPGDPLYPDQWALPRIAWDQVFGTVTPTGIAKVAILDTGVDALHPELAGVLVPGTSILDSSGGTTDPSGHGTWLAGIVAAQTGGTSPDGIAGVAYDGVRIMPVTVLNASGEGLDSDVIAGVIWAVDHGADVILMAFSNPGFSPALQEAIDYAWSRGVVLVAAAGNGATNAPTFPAGDRGVMGVAATDQNDAQAAFSNEGEAVFIAAPGTDIPTTSSGDAYAVINGTSAAAAHVAGLAAFMKAVDPTLSNGVIVFRIASTADPAGTQIQTGNGRINMARALASTATEFIQPAGADPLAEGGPFVGPYLAAAVNINSFAANCNTATESFATGTTVCAKVTGLSNGASGKVEWFAPGASSATRTTIFTNVNGNFTDTFAPAVCGTWTLKAFSPAATFQADDTFVVTGCNAAPVINRNNASATVNEGATASNSGTWSDANAGDTVTLTASVGSVTKSGTNAAGTWSWSFATTDGPDQSQTVTITADDGNGGTATTTFSLTVSNVPPTVAFTGGDTTVNENGVTQHTYTYSITDPGNDTITAVTTSCGTGGAKVASSDSFTNTSGSFKCVFPDGPASPTLTVQATDSDGAAGNTATLGVTVNNVPPTVAFTGGDTTVNENGVTQHTYTYSITDPGNDTITAVTTSCGTGGAKVASSDSFTNTSGSFKCVFPDGPASPTLTVQATDSDGAAGNTATLGVTVNNVPPTVAFTGGDTTVNENGVTQHTYTYSITDPGDDTITVATSCGTGGAKVASSDSFTNTSGSFKCVFPDGPASPTLTVQATDSDGAAGNTATLGVTVNNVPPTVAFTGGDTTVNENGVTEHTYTYSITEHGDDTITAVATSCGTGGAKVASSDSFTNTSGSFKCVFPDGPASPTLTVQATDSDGAAGNSATLGVTVTNVAPTITAVSPTSVLVGQTVTFTGTATDPSSADTAAGFAWSWNGGVTFGEPNANTLTSSYGVCGSYTVAALAKDKDGGVSTSFTSTVSVWNGNFLEPLREGTSNLVQKGRVVPVKISFGCGGPRTGLAPAIQLLNGDFVDGAGTESQSNEITLSVSNADTTGIMREVDSKYMYNLAIPNNSTWGPGKPLTIRVSPFGNGTSPVMYILLEIRK